MNLQLIENYILVVQNTSTGVFKETPAELVIRVSSDILKRLPPEFDRDAALEKYPTDYHQVYQILRYQNVIFVYVKL